MKFEETNWSKTDIEDIYDKLYTAEDKAEMLLHLLNYKPVLNLEFDEMCEEIGRELLFGCFDVGS